MILLTKNLLTCFEACKRKKLLCKYQQKMENLNTYSTYTRKIMGKKSNKKIGKKLQTITKEK
jgi:hypothetical protein